MGQSPLHWYRKLDHSLAYGVALLAVLLAAALLNCFTTVQQRRDAEWVNHTHEVLDTLQEFQSSLGEARADLRGHILTASFADLGAFEAHVALAHAHLARFGKLTADDAGQQAALPALREDLAHLEKIWRESIDIFARRGEEAAKRFFFSQVDGRGMIARVYARVGDMQAHERDLLRQRAVQSHRAYLVSLWSGIAAGMFSTVLVGLYTTTLRRHARTTARTAAQLTELTEALQQADSRKDAFIATLAHELRNPLAPIRNAAAILSRDVDPQRLRWVSQVLSRQVGHMAVLLDDLLDVARITQGKLVLQRRPTALKEVVEAAVEAAMPLIQARQHVLGVAPVPVDVEIDVDPVRISQALTNLLNNAARYTAPAGSIKLDVAIRGADLELQVSDNGVGIEPEAQRRIFSMFEQVKAGSQDGLGIGLALTRGLVELHGGSIVVHSEGLGQGSCFTVRLPAVVQATAATGTVTVAPEQKSAAGCTAAVDGVAGQPG